MNEYELKSDRFTAKMRKEVQSTVKWLKDDYSEANEKVGKPKATYEFEAYRAMKAERRADGCIHYTYDKNGKLTYECVLTIKFPLRYLPFEAVDVHTYRWNEKRQEWEHESTDIF